MKIALREFEWDGIPCAAYFVYCPACENAHRFMVKSPDKVAVWQFNGNLEAPTFQPSLLVERRNWENETWVRHICHSYLTDSIWNFLADSTHNLAGIKTPMVDFPNNYRV